MSKAYPLLALRGLHVFPGQMLSLEVGRPHSLAALDAALNAPDRLLFCTAQQDSEDESPQAKLFKQGSLVVVQKVLRLGAKAPDSGTVRVFVEGVARAALTRRTENHAYVTEHVEISHNTPKVRAMDRMVREAAEQLIPTFRHFQEADRNALNRAATPAAYGDAAAHRLLTRADDRQAVLAALSLPMRLEKLLTALRHELEIAQVEQRIQKRVKKQLDQNQKEYVLREQIRAIKQELGDSSDRDINELRRRAGDTPLSGEAKDAVLAEIDRLSAMPPGSHEVTVSRNWLDWVLALPWHEPTSPKNKGNGVTRARSILERDHYGLCRVKERVLEYLAVRQLATVASRREGGCQPGSGRQPGSGCQQGSCLNGPILCLVGPPGVGKTSIGRSIATALDRPFYRLSLGGVHDESEIRGHRRTYVGAIPGRILAALRQVGEKNPLMVLDEIDKLSHDCQGDPAGALLEVLDAEQNHAFMDHYLSCPFDLSHIFFIATANSVDTIPRALHDRMEIIDCPGYTDSEKLQIAKRHLLPRQLKMHGLSPTQCGFTDAALRAVMEGYTRESGVRQLERSLGAVCRKAALRQAEKSSQKMVSVTVRNLEDFLGAPLFRRNPDAPTDTPGLATGLAWTAVGGETLQVEVLRLPGTGKLMLTGQMGDVMQESAQTAASLVRRVAQDRGIELDITHEDWHVHIPEGAVQKDGPSAGITIGLAMLSACTKRRVLPRLCMTGELTLTGRVLPVGGIKEKVLAANRAGYRTVILPDLNRRDLEDLPGEVRDRLDFIPVSNFEQVVAAGLHE